MKVNWRAIVSSAFPMALLIHSAYAERNDLSERQERLAAQRPDAAAARGDKQRPRVEDLGGSWHYARDADKLSVIRPGEGARVRDDR